MAHDKLSVKQCLIVIALMCAPLILWGGYQMTFTESISAADVKVGQPIVVRGHYPGWCGAPYWVFVHKESSPDDLGGEEVVEASAESGFASRGWLGYYRFEVTLAPIDESGEYSVSFDYLNRQSIGIPTTTVNVLP